ncbi:la protein homolog [Schistocerca americana]|uniref:la protein homolog n=1 Tax=Schistocerca americana TaxID=7009 RepID=UPI001F4FD579|nr:la protein homolog [Schistocerca americana]XP_047117352.1 la protein homolog [Schistocerca piceifrons]
MAEENDISVGTEEKTDESKNEKTDESKSEAGKDAVSCESVADKDEPPKNGDLKLLEKQIIRQVEYYFGDINLPRDRFLQEQIKLDDGWVPLTVMLNFQRLSNLTKDTSIIANALEKSSLLEISEDRSKIRRSPDQPLPVWNEERRKELMTRTLYLKGFPVQDTTLDKLLDFFAQHSTVENVQMRTYKDKATNKFVFKGSVFATFPTKEKAEEFLNKEIKYDGNDLIRKWQSVYVEEKRKEREEAKAKRKGGAQNEADKKALPKGAILHLKGLTSDISREQINEKLSGYEADVAYISYDKGDEEGWIRLQGENSTKAVLEKIGESTIEIGNVKIEVRALEGEEEEEFLKKTMEDIQKRRFHYNQNKRGRRGGGRGGFRGDRKRKQTSADSTGEPPSKVAAKSE